MKRYLKLSLLAIFLVLVTAGYLELRRGHAETLPPPVAQQTETATRTVQVTGVGEIQVEPDSAVIWLGVQTEASTAQAALDQNNTKMETLIETLEEADIPSEDIQTQTLHLGPRYEFEDDTRTLVGYVASNVVEVRTDDLDTIGSLVDMAVRDGANVIENINFEVSNPENMTDRARQTAFQNALHKAEELADLANATLGPIMEIRETSSTPGPIVRSEEMAADAAAVPISPGSQSVSVEIQVTWTLLTSSEQ